MVVVGLTSKDVTLSECKMICKYKDFRELSLDEKIEVLKFLNVDDEIIDYYTFYSQHKGLCVKLKQYLDKYSLEDCIQTLPFSQKEKELIRECFEVGEGKVIKNERVLKMIQEISKHPISKAVFLNILISKKNISGSKLIDLCKQLGVPYKIVGYPAVVLYGLNVKILRVLTYFNILIYYGGENGI